MNGYDNPSTTGGYGHASKDRDAAYSQQTPSIYNTHAHGAAAPPYQVCMHAHSAALSFCWLIICPCDISPDWHWVIKLISFKRMEQ